MELLLLAVIACVLVLGLAMFVRKLRAAQRQRKEELEVSAAVDQVFESAAGSTTLADVCDAELFETFRICGIDVTAPEFWAQVGGRPASFDVARVAATLRTVASANPSIAARARAVAGARIRNLHKMAYFFGIADQASSQDQRALVAALAQHLCGLPDAMLARAYWRMCKDVPVMIQHGDGQPEVVLAGVMRKGLTIGEAMAFERHVEYIFLAAGGEPEPEPEREVVVLAV